MKWTLFSVVATFGLLFTLSSRVSAATLVYLSLKLDGAQVQGDCLQKGREGSIECLSYNQLVSAPGATTAAAGMGRSATNVGQITIIKAIDKSSPLLLKALQEGQNTEGLFKFWRAAIKATTGVGSEVQFYNVHGKNGVITSVRQFVPNELDTAIASPQPLEEVTFAFTNVDYTINDGGITSSISNAGGTAVVGASATVAGTTPPIAPPTTTGAVPGGQCVLGTTYTMGVDNSPLNLTVKRAEYSPGHVTTSKGADWATKDEKLLVLHYTLENPTAAAQPVGRVSIDWTAVTANGINRPQEEVIVEGTTQDLNEYLLPAQSVDVYTVFYMPAAGAVSTLIAHPHGNATTADARFDMTGKITALPVPYADTKDATGSTLLPEVPGGIGGTYVLGPYDVKVVGTEKADMVMMTRASTGNTFLL